MPFNNPCYAFLSDALAGYCFLAILIVNHCTWAGIPDSEADLGGLVLNLIFCPIIIFIELISMYYEYSL